MLGLLEWEQREVQTLDVELHLGLSLDGAAGGDLGRSVNYASSVDQVQFIAQQGRWLLLESMSSAMARLLLAAPLPFERRAQVSEVIVRLSKPEVFKGRAVPSIEIRRNIEWARTTQTKLRAAEMTILQETRETGAYRIHLHSGQQWPVPTGMAIQVLAGRVVNGHDTLLPGASIARSTSTVLHAPDEGALLLGVAQPPLSAES
jgi:dihydroneopterin aldolase